jgi:hypothetical protein
MFSESFEMCIRCVSLFTVHLEPSVIAASAFHQESLPLLPSGKVDRRALKFGVLALSLLSLKGPDPSGCNATIPFAKQSRMTRGNRLARSELGRVFR